MSMYNLLEYSKNYKKTTGSLWNYYRDKPSDPLSSNPESFKYKTSITANTYNLVAGDNGYDAKKVVENDTKLVVPLKHLINFWRTLDTSLINCEINLISTWSKNCVLVDVTIGDAVAAPTELKFKIKTTKLYVLVVTLSTENDNKLFK